MATRPGFHPTTNFQEYPEILGTAIRAIGRHFYVTRSFKNEKIGNSEYWALLARPAEDFSVHLNADREILFVFSTYDNFEIRTLEAFDLFFANLEQKRVDKSIRFLISADKRIEEIIQHYLNQHPEYPIVIPIHLPSINEKGEQILEAIRRNYLLRDLFGYQNPLREETFFFGRQEQVNTVLDLAKSGQSASIFGLRKSGKTSSIYAIMRRARSFGFTPVFLDCQNPAVHARRYNELLSLIVEESRRSIGHQKKINPIEGSDVEISEAFRSQMKTALGQAKTNFLLIFDEIENISPRTAASRHWEDDLDSLLLWQNIRSFVQQESNGRVAVCLVGTSPLLLEQSKIHDVPNPMYLFSQKRFLPAFSFEDTKEMIERLGFFMGLEFDQLQIAKLQKLYGGHPFFIRQVCSKVHQIASTTRPIEVSEKLLDSAIEQFGGQLGSYLSDILDNLKAFYPDEFELLEAVVNGDSSEISEYGREAPELIDHLIGYGLVERKGDSYDIRFDAVKFALMRLFEKEDTRYYWKEISERRNELEVNIRRELFFFSKGVDAGDWETILKESISGRRFHQLKNLEPRFLFSAKESPLYWTDLLALLKNRSVFPHLKERRSALTGAMQVVNEKGRPDAHAKELSAQEADEVRAALVVLEDEFSMPL